MLQKDFLLQYFMVLMNEMLKEFHIVQLSTGVWNDVWVGLK